MVWEGGCGAGGAGAMTHFTGKKRGMRESLQTVLRADVDVSASVVDLITNKLVQPTTARHFRHRRRLLARKWFLRALLNLRPSLLLLHFPSFPASVLL